MKFAMNNSFQTDFSDFSLPPVEAETVQIEVESGVKIFVDIWSRPSCHKQPFLLLHGLASNARMWDQVAKILLQLGHNVVVPDLRGHGRSSKPDYGYDFSEICSDIEKVHDYLIGKNSSWQQLIAVGQSWGASLVLELAWRSPHRFFGIACVDGGFVDLCDVYKDWQSCEAALRPPILTSMTPEELENRIRATHSEWPSEGVDALLANFYVNENGTVSPHLSLNHHLDILHSLWMFRPSVRYLSITVPVLLIPAISEKDALYPDNKSIDKPKMDKRASVQDAKSKLAKADVYEFLNADHDIHASLPDKLANLLHEKCVGFFHHSD